MFKGEILTKFDNIEDEQIHIPPNDLFSSCASTLINHYMAFSNTLRGEPDMLIREQMTGEVHGDPARGSKSGVSEGRLGHDIQQDFAKDTKTHQKSTILAVIPAFNEEIAIGTVVLITRAYVDHVIVVDDGSTDKTAHIADLAGAEVIRIKKNRGKAHALLVGLARAKESGCNAVVILDGDGQHKPEEIPNLLTPVLSKEADMVIGSRFLNINSAVPSYRRMGQKTLDYATNIESSYKSTDTQSGFRALSCYALKFLDFQSDDYNIESDMISHFSANGLRITEVPITVLYDVPHKSKKHPLSHGADVLGHLIGVIGYRRPLLSFGVPGIIFLIGGLIIGSIAFAEYYITSKFSFLFSMVCIVFLFVGLLLMTTGLILNSLVLIMKMER
jgi:glycosyltransferase involved in cell wall biosynthesis